MEIEPTTKGYDAAASLLYIYFFLIISYTGKKRKTTFIFNLESD